MNRLTLYICLVYLIGFAFWIACVGVGTWCIYTLVNHFCK